MTIDDILKQSWHLPASRIATKLNETLGTHSTAVVTAPPGAGKSTLLPLTMTTALKTHGKILMLEPRRLAARQIAERMSDMLGEDTGQTVGYRVRFETRVSRYTRIEVITEGILTRMLIDDATLDGVDIVIFDEFHERSINSDLALALTLQCQRLIRPDLRIVIMSATIDTQELCHQLRAPLLESEGRMFDVKTIHAQEDTTASTAAQDTARTIIDAHRNFEGDILAFLPGQGDIEQCCTLLGASLGDTAVYPLYGNLPPEIQHKAIAPSRDGCRKVVLATPVAETSLTIEGVKIVVDSGLYRTLVHDPHTALSHLQTMRISFDMATQRTGRAGRVAPGTCYRLWTLATEHRMAQQRVPEIMTGDLAPMLLAIASFGEHDVWALPWLSAPPASNVAQASQLLVSLGAIGKDGCVTPLGKRMASMPCHPRIARMILGAATPHLKALACDIAALLEEKDPLSELGDCDMTLRIDSLRQARTKQQTGRWKRIAQVAHEYLHMAHVHEDNTLVGSYDAGLLVALAYPERIAMATDGIGNYRLASGREVSLPQKDRLTAYTWLAVASLNASPTSRGSVFMAAPVDIDNIDASLLSTRDNISWDSKQGCVVTQREVRIGRLLVNTAHIHDADRKDVISAICNAARKEGLSMFTWNESIERLQRRVQTVAEWHPELPVPDISTKHMLDTAHEWLPFYIEQGSRMMTSADALRKIDMAEVAWALIPYDMQQRIDHLAPTHITVPTGSRIRIDYRIGAEAPVLSVRLQECFGMEHTPCVDDGHHPLLMELLSPGFKPVQLTQDLENFWKCTYFEVRKELRRRYPKHYWPENPLEAEAVRGVAKKKKM